MCGRYVANTEEELIEIRDILTSLAERLTADSTPAATDRITVKDTENKQNVVPTQRVKVFLKNGELAECTWGFKHWMADNKSVIFNARSENAPSSRFFAQSFNNDRCLVPAYRYIEWEKTIKGKIPYNIGLPKYGFILMAGLVNRQNPLDTRFTILTREASDDIRFIHDRMPVILLPADAGRWLSGEMNRDALENTAVKNVEFMTA